MYQMTFPINSYLPNTLRQALPTSGTTTSKHNAEANDRSENDQQNENKNWSPSKKPTTPSRILNTTGAMLVDSSATIVRTIVGVPPERIKSICHQKKIYPWVAVGQMNVKDMYKGVGYASIFNLSQVPMKQIARRTVNNLFPDMSIAQKSVSAATLSTLGEVGIGFPLYKLFFYSADRKTNDLVGVAKHMLKHGGVSQLYHGVGFRTLLHLKFNTACFSTMDTVTPWLKGRGWSDSNARIASGFAGAAAGTLANHHMDILCTHAAVMEPSHNRPTHLQMMQTVGEAEQKKLIQKASQSQWIKQMGSEVLESQLFKHLTLTAGIYRAALPALPAKFIALVPSMGAAMGAGIALTALLKETETFSTPAEAHNR